MHLDGYYSSGQFAKMAQVSLRTIRYYDKQNILKPSFVNENGARFYTDTDLAKLQQILLLKYLGFSLDDIREMTIGDGNLHMLKSSLSLQKKLIQDRIEQMQLVEKAINSTISEINSGNELDWSQMLDLIHLTNMEKSLKSQYQNANNISARIRLHRDYSTNEQGWFPWVYEKVEETLHISTSTNNLDNNILELGCGNGALWRENIEKIPANISITLSDISEGMIREVRRSIGRKDKRFSYKTFDCHKIPFENDSFDCVIANHVLFYCEKIDQVCKEIKRVLKPNGIFICSTYGTKHMKEITELVQGFDERIVLASENLYDRFGLENGKEILSKHFSDVTLENYEDEIVIRQAEPIIEYILSCHGNQNQYLLNRYHDFKGYVEKKLYKDMHITKDAGMFVCRN
ncbi:MAG: methyltransferase domain-containing protein [Agathobacter sp.]|nr:methyltransferase domain-containing protein [Agathobacter sp.]